MSQPSPEKEPFVLTDSIKRWSNRVMNPLGRVLHRVGVPPNGVTWAGLVLVGVAAVLVASGNLRVGGLLLVLALPFDALDGAVARARGHGSKFGAMLDSTLDRYADGFIFAGLSYYFAMTGDMGLFVASQAALIGSLLVSYTRARADGVGVATKVGWFTRFERTVVIVWMLLLPFLLVWGVLLLATGTNITAMQRLWFVHNELKTKGD